jgi:DNA polymerase/3'-5' exonuclease PolX
MKVAKKPKNKTIKLKELIDKKKDLKYGFAEILSELETINAARGEQFKSQAYKKAWEEIMSYPGPIISSSDLKGKKGMGKVMIEKLEEYEKTGKVQKLLDLKKDPITLLTTVYGIGGVKAKSLVNEGCLTVNDLRERLDLLNEKQKIGLKYYDDIMERIPRFEIDEYKIFLEKATNEIQEQLKISKIHFEIVGSYRRGAITSGDIDIILTYSSDASTNTQILSKFYKKLTEEGMVKELLASGTKKRLVIGKLPNSNYLYRRIDFLFTSPQEYPFAILLGLKHLMYVCVVMH